jgi:hypothetical protein
MASKPLIISHLQIQTAEVGPNKATAARLAETNELRSRIKAGAVLQCLQEHALGQRKMGDTQIKAAAILLRKGTARLGCC